MNRKNNPLVSLVALLLLALILVLTCSGCRKAEATHQRFTVEENIYEMLTEKRAYIITDTDTGHQYLLFRYGDASGMVEMGD